MTEKMWIQETSTWPGHEGRPLPIWNLHGVGWHEAPPPKMWRFHKCKIQTRGHDGNGIVYRCACGGISFDNKYWMKRNQKVRGFFRRGRRRRPR